MPTAFITFLTIALVAAATSAFGEAPDQKQYNGMIKNVHDGYQSALTKLGTDANYNRKMSDIDNEYNRKLAELGIGPSHTINGHFGKGIQTDKALEIGGPEKDKNNPEPEPKDWTASGSIGIVKQK